MKPECYAASRPQEGRSANEDAFLIGRGAVPCVALCDGAGNAQRAAKRVLTLFEKLFHDRRPSRSRTSGSGAAGLSSSTRPSWAARRVTFVGVALLDGIAIGACAGDSRAYLLDREGACRILTEGANKRRLGSGDASAFPIRQPLSPGDTLLLMSDGAWTPLGPYLLTKAVLGEMGRHFSEVPPAILDAAGRTGRPDDMTVVAVRL